ncbi:uncharacterized protein LOC122263792 isoform X2 [Penaeus japonicus]|uniref:uncharacterized protein LOC122263792 isoform X2 n=1 Tax=Penaeus japonicus TaxID=27405 RepID=UPI001C70EB2E|nr:uncharacterized protein LOC122263792 isoform X2 [Penaeus japonicus]
MRFNITSEAEPLRAAEETMLEILSDLPTEMSWTNVITTGDSEEAMKLRSFRSNVKYAVENNKPSEERNICKESHDHPGTQKKSLRDKAKPSKRKHPVQTSQRGEGCPQYPSETLTIFHLSFFTFSPQDQMRRYMSQRWILWKI